jgi:hypothetical protein
VLFIDAGTKTRAPYDFYRAQANATEVLYSHALAPEVLLKVYQQFYQEVAPEVFVLCVCGEQFELGEGLSAPAVVRLEQALAFCKILLIEPNAEMWSRQCGQKAA